MVRRPARRPACGREDCTFPALFAVLGRAHVTDILFVLTHEGGRPMRFTALQRRLGLHPKLLTSTLRDLEVLGLVSRRNLGGFPPKIEYSVPERWLPMAGPIESLHELWEEAQDLGSSDA